MEEFPFSLPGYARYAVAEVVTQTGYPFVVTEQPGLGQDSEMRLARKGRPYHELAYRPEYRDHALHFLVNGARKVLRVWAAPPGERYVAAVRLDGELPGEDYLDLCRRNPHLGVPDLQDVSRYLFHGIMRQLTSMPVDLRVERDLVEDLPEHREAQRRYLVLQVKELEPHFAREIAHASPPSIYAASSAMNIAFAEEAARLSGAAPGHVFRDSPHALAGQRLCCHLHAEPSRGHAGDRRVTDAWARELRMEGWFEWTAFSDE